MKYRRRTLRLLPDKGRPSYAGSVVDALEGLDALPGGAARGAHRPLTGSAAPSKYPAQLRYKDVHATVPSRYTTVSAED